MGAQACPLHGDDMEAAAIGTIRAKAVDCVSFGGMFGERGSAFGTHLIIWLMFNDILNTTEGAMNTVKTMRRHLVWSLYWLYIGRHPDRDPDGNLYTEGPAFERAGSLLAGGFSELCGAS